ncbi:hypothetical protein HZ326_10005 [Fusarium oxysporum f. sp. albedinis]|nr:hypothetical protein HZ326_10005 [Fusarium oxysporum f. sp. albedinis]
MERSFVEHCVLHNVIRKDGKLCLQCSSRRSWYLNGIALTQCSSSFAVAHRHTLYAIDRPLGVLIHDSTGARSANTLGHMYAGVTENNVSSAQFRYEMLKLH